MIGDDRRRNVRFSFYQRQEHQRELLDPMKGGPARK